MIAVIVGDLDRESAEDKVAVVSLMNKLKNKYRDLTIVSAACERGIGSIVRNRCLDKDNKDFSFIELGIRVWKITDKDKLSKIYSTRNATLQELGEIFFVFSSGWRLGHISDLLDRLKKNESPLVVYDKEMKKETFNFSEDIENLDLQDNLTPLSSSGLKGELI
jgi:hypothetical protein